ncbi:MAG: sigma-54-dependent transcriptional regulator [Candidatus Eisenbacteria bacterium]|nr:sigma-54 dependent transcriptional regulator [Candidatus Eisenbacteria bacterium]
MARILLIDDDPSFREVLSFTLGEAGHEVEAIGDGRKAVSLLSSFRPDVVLTDLKMPGIDGMEVLRRVTEADATVPVILLTAFGTIEAAVEAMKAGAHHYLTKPYNRDELKLAVAQALEWRRLQKENRELRHRLRERVREDEVIHASEAMTRILEMARRIAPTDANVLLTGESGTGKEVIAHSLHAWSDRWEGPFVAVNCAAIPKDLLESELFGHVRGAFTGATKDKQGKFQRADGGTLFLDEIADLPADMQTKLLRAIETRQIDVVGGTHPVHVDARLIAATNADIEARVRDGSFRSDLYYRLDVIRIHIPPLRERPDDIPALWEHFVRRFAGPSEAVRTSPELMRELMRRPWPGNVRELANVCQRMVLLRRGDTLTLDDLPVGRTGEVPLPIAGEANEATAEGVPPARAGESTIADALLRELPEDRLPLIELEREVIVRALAKHGGNRTRTAEYLGIPRHVLLYRLEKYGIA